VRRLLRRSARAVGCAVKVTARRWKEILLACAYVLGWGLLTWGLARLLVWEVWLISGGAFFLSLGGIGLLKDVAVEGLYVLDRRGGGKS
jgi:hypothetical protein